MFDFASLCPECHKIVIIEIDLEHIIGTFTCPHCGKTRQYLITLGVEWDSDITFN